MKTHVNEIGRRLKMHRHGLRTDRYIPHPITFQDTKDGEILSRAKIDGVSVLENLLTAPRFSRS
jgi:hypothetical protein